MHASSGLLRLLLGRGEACHKQGWKGRGNRKKQTGALQPTQNNCFLASPATDLARVASGAVVSSPCAHTKQRQDRKEKQPAMEFMRPVGGAHHMKETTTRNETEDRGQEERTKRAGGGDQRWVKRGRLYGRSHNDKLGRTKEETREEARRGRNRRPWPKKIEKKYTWPLARIRDSPSTFSSGQARAGSDPGPADGGRPISGDQQSLRVGQVLADWRCCPWGPAIQQPRSHVQGWWPRGTGRPSCKQSGTQSKHSEAE